MTGIDRWADVNRTATLFRGRFRGILCTAVFLSTCQWAGAGAGGAADRIPPPPTPESGKIVDGLACDTDGARKAWTPMKATAGVSVVETAGRRILRMPCNFASTRIERASWDRRLGLDMAACLGLAFDFYCPDTAPVSHFSLYFKSGDGWYSAGFHPAPGRWQTVAVTKEQTRTEGSPAGWGRVEAMRISAWRGANRDTAFYIAGLRLTGGDAPIAVIRGSGDGAGRYASNVVRCLADLGLPYTVIAEPDVTRARLAGMEMVILPHNPGMAKAAVAETAAWLKRGGKMISFYSLSGPLAAAAGVKPGTFHRRKEEGRFAEIRPAGRGLEGMPAAVKQASWNIRAVDPLAGTSRVAATWYDRNGKDTGLPAVTVSGNAACMTHVLLDDDWKNKRKLMLAMVGHFLPDLRRRAAARQVERIGVFGRFSGLDELAAAVRDENAAAAAAITRAAKQKREAAALLAKAQCAAAMDRATAARRQSIRAFCLAQEPAKNEHRAFWCHSAFGVKGMTWDEAIGRLADNGFTAILPNMLWGGVAFYPSAVLPVHPSVETRGDQVAACLAACKKHGVECHVWKVNFNMGSRSPASFARKMAAAGRTQVSRGGEKKPRWLCPSHPVNRQLEIAAMVEVAEKYAVDGIHFDYIRYPGPDYCFCAGCRQRFAKAIGRTVDRWPADVLAGGPLQEQWLDFRRTQITAVVAAVADRARTVRPGIAISAAVFRRQPADADRVGQDWRAWCTKGYLDFVCPMDYTTGNPGFASWVDHQVVVSGNVPCYPGIGFSTWPAGDRIVRLIEQIGITRARNTGGFTVFNYDPAAAGEMLPLAGLGITRKKQ